MAIWQFTINIIPRESLIKRYGKIPVTLEMDWQNRLDLGKDDALNEEQKFDALSIPWWLDLNVEFNSLIVFLKQFGDLQRWTENMDGLRSYGDVESNDVSVCFNSMTNIIEELSCRIDMRDHSFDFRERVFSIAKQYNCLLLDSQGRLFEPTNKELDKVIQLSNANRFVKNPNKFLDDLSKGVIKL